MLTIFKIRNEAFTPIAIPFNEIPIGAFFKTPNDTSVTKSRWLKTTNINGSHNAIYFADNLPIGTASISMNLKYVIVAGRIEIE